MTVLVTMVGAISYSMLVRGQEVQIHRELAFSAKRADPSSPPGCTWVFFRRGGTLVATSVPSPPGFPRTETMDRVAATGSTVLSTVKHRRTVYYVHTRLRDGHVVQAVFDARYQLDDRRHLLAALAVAELVGLLAAAVTGIIVGGRAVAPLAEALSRQRRFIADASHELRTPIAQVHIRAQLMARRARTGGSAMNLEDLDLAHRRHPPTRRDRGRPAALGPARRRARRPPSVSAGRFHRPGGRGGRRRGGTGHRPPGHPRGGPARRPPARAGCRVGAAPGGRRTARERAPNP